MRTREERIIGYHSQQILNILRKGPGHDALVSRYDDRVQPGIDRDHDLRGEAAVSMDPDLYGPPEHEPPDPPQDDDWEAFLEMYADLADDDG